MSIETSVHAVSEVDETVDTRERLVRAAIEVFLEKGYGGTRVQDIARRAGFTSGALYVHFPSRTALLGEAIIREGDAILSSMVTKLAETRPGEGRIAGLLAELSGSEPSDLDRLLLEALALATRDADARAMLSGSLQAYVDTVLGRVREAQDGGLIDPELPPEAVAHVLLAMVFGAVMTNSLQLVTVNRDDVSSINDRLLRGLRPGA
jgi:AcrR family transcriptional regulator